MSVGTMPVGGYNGAVAGSQTTYKAFGFEVADSNVAAKVRLVVYCSALILLVDLAFTVVEMRQDRVWFSPPKEAKGSTEGWAFDLSLPIGAIGLLIPACGYFGAKSKNQGLLCCFSSCNMCTVLMSLIFVLATLAAQEFTLKISGLEKCCVPLENCSWAPENCICTNQTVPEINDLIVYPRNNSACPRVTPRGQGGGEENRRPHNRETVCITEGECGFWKKLVAVPKSGWNLLIIIAILPCLPSCCGCIVGISLQRDPSFTQPKQFTGFMAEAPPVGAGYMGTVVPTQPVYGSTSLTGGPGGGEYGIVVSSSSVDPAGASQQQIGVVVPRQSGIPA